MTKAFSKTQIDRLGDRLKKGEMSEADLQMLDEYRRSFAEAFGFLVRTIRKELALEPTGRPAKSTSSICEKLRRESIRLTQIQDIAGCRLIVPDIASQETIVQSLKNLFEHTTIVDRRQQPSHGYRAVHVIVSCLDKVVEIQVRTSLQHLWAELSERISDVLGPAIKYGGGDESVREVLTGFSSSIITIESTQARLQNLEVQRELISLKQRISDKFRETIKLVEGLKRSKDKSNDISH